MSINSATWQTINAQEKLTNTNHAQIWSVTYSTPASQDQTPIICLHGGPGSNHEYLTSLKKLATQNPVILYDQSGCNKSITNNPDFTDFTLDYYTQELTDFIDQLGYKQVYLLGHSWGAMLATNFALKSPDKIAKLILSGACLSSPMWIKDCQELAKSLPGNIYEIMLKHETNQTTNDPEYETAVEEFYRNFFCRTNPYPQEVANAMSKLNRQIYVSMWGSYETCATGNLKDIDLVPQLHKLHMPTLFICGEYDTATPASMQFCADQMPDAKLVVIKDAAHVAPAEKPVEFINTVHEFLK